MADKKISELSPRSIVTETDEFLNLVGGVNYRSPVGAVVSLVGSTGGSAIVSDNTYVLSNADNNKLGYFTAAGPVTISVPPGLSLPFKYQIVQAGDQVTVVPNTGVTVHHEKSLFSTSAKYNPLTLVAVALDLYVLSGATAAKVTPPSEETTPVNTSPPVITQSGSRLNATQGIWTGDPVEFRYQWNRAAVPISGAEGTFYTLTEADVGQMISVTVTASNQSDETGMATSLAYGPILGSAPTNTVAPTITGGSTPPKVGETLSITPGTWTGSPAPTFAIQWKSADVAIPGATLPAYQIALGDLGDTITVTVTATNTAGSASVTTAGVGPIAATADVTPPVLSAFSLEPTSETTAQLSVSTNEGNGIFYWVAVLDGLPAPNATQIKAGTDGAGNPANASGSIDVTSIDTWGTNPSTLSAGTTYDAYGVMYDAAGLASNVVTDEFTQPGSSFPVLSTQSVLDHADIFAWLSVTTNNGNGTLYVVVVPADDPAPSNAQIKAGQNSASAAAPSASQVMTSTGTKLLLVRGLIANTLYRAYFVQEVTAGFSNSPNAPFTTDVLVIAFLTDGTATGLSAPTAANGSAYVLGVADPYGGTNAITWQDNNDGTLTASVVTTTMVVTAYYSGVNKFHWNMKYTSGVEYTRMAIANVTRAVTVDFNAKTAVPGTGWNGTMRSRTLGSNWFMYSGEWNMAVDANGVPIPTPDLNGAFTWTLALTTGNASVPARNGTHIRGFHDFRITRPA